MKKIVLITLLAVSLIFIGNNANGQPVNNYGQNFTMQDYLGTTYSLYTYTDAGKPVIMDVSAVWCGPCWSYHTGGALENYYNAYGPPGDNSSMVLWIEGDENSLACLQGNTTLCPSTKGNWTAGTTFPMILTVAPNTNQVVIDYNTPYFPTINLICPNRLVTEVGQLNDAGLHAAALGCPAPGVNALDAAVWSTNVPSGLCETSVTPAFYLQNYGSITLTSCNVVIKLDGSTVSTTPWSGSLAKYEIDDVVLPAVTGITDGTHTLTFEITSPNGGTDANTANNTKDVSFAASLPIVSIPFSEGFISSTFPPANWILYNPDAGFTWSKKAGAGGFGNSTSCAKMDFLNSTEGNIDDLIIAPVDLSSATAFGMAFNVAYARYDATYSDQMQVQVSTNCGTIWTTVWDKQGTALATAPDAITSFTPTASQWRAETINLNSYIGQASVFVKFHAISGWGNNCYVDDINLAVDAGVGSIDGIVNNINVYPNPFSNNTNVEFSIAKTENASFGVYNLIGEKVLSIDETAYGAGTHTVTINANDLSQGIYYLNAIVGDQKFTQKLTIVK